MEELQLKKNGSGSTVRIVTTIQTQEIPLSADELRRQIKQHAEILDNLQRTLTAVEAFEAGSKDEDTVQVPVEAAAPLLDKDARATITEGV